MMKAVMWALGQSIKVLGVVGAWMLFKAIVRNGSGTINDILETVEMGLQAGGLLLKRKFFEIIRKEKRKPDLEEPAKAEGSVV